MGIAKLAELSDRGRRLGGPVSARGTVQEYWSEVRLAQYLRIPIRTIPPTTINKTIAPPDMPAAPPGSLPHVEPFMRRPFQGAVIEIEPVAVDNRAHHASSEKQKEVNHRDMASADQPPGVMLPW